MNPIYSFDHLVIAGLVPAIQSQMLKHNQFATLDARNKSEHDNQSIPQRYHSPVIPANAGEIGSTNDEELAQKMLDHIWPYPMPGAEKFTTPSDISLPGAVILAVS